MWLYLCQHSRTHLLPSSRARGWSDGRNLAVHGCTRQRRYAGRAGRTGDARHIDGALEQMQSCTSDPLCAEHMSLKDRSLHEAACHACLFLPETSCERGNKYLDRSVLFPTVDRANLAFFEL